jgi:hypothetical protein
VSLPPPAPSEPLAFSLFSTTSTSSSETRYWGPPTQSQPQQASLLATLTPFGAHATLDMRPPGFAPIFASSFASSATAKCEALPTHWNETKQLPHAVKKCGECEERYATHVCLHCAHILCTPCSDRLHPASRLQAPHTRVICAIDPL